MTDVIHHRGPDEAGSHRGPGVAMGMRRLSIIDLDTGSQPVFNESGDVCTVFNGEIYNFAQLRSELVERGHVFATRGDTETIVHLYEEYGLDFPRKLRGMFAIALWDAPRRRLVLVRDRMGVKPLYVAEGPWGLAFGSEVKSLIATGLIEPVLDPEAAELFLAFGYVPGPSTLFAGVRKLTPASTLVWEDGRVAQESPYWTPMEDAPSGVGRDWREDQEQLLELLRRSVHARMVSDVPLGVMLSGGLDSSLITALMAERSTHPVKTFSVGFAEDAEANELPDARRVAQHFGTEHHELVTSATDHPDLLEHALWHLEEPVADISCLGFVLLCQLARESVTVSLSGQGADELLGGYRKHQVAAGADLMAHIPAPMRSALLGAARREGRGAAWSRGLIAMLSEDGSERMLAMSRVVHADQRLETLGPSLLQPDAEELIAGVFRRIGSGGSTSVLGQTLYQDSKLALVDNMLLYFDKMSMASSLEVRVPFMDHDLVSFCFALPDSRKVLGTRRKELLKRASSGLLEPGIIHKKKRGFFHAALDTWLRHHRDGLVRAILLDERARARGQYRRETVERLVASAGEDGKKDAQRLYCLLLLETWQRMFVDSDGPGRQLFQTARAGRRMAA